MAGLYDAPTLSSLRVGKFKGLDTSEPEDQIEAYRAAKTINLMPGAAGEVMKRPGMLYKEHLPAEIVDGGRVIRMIAGKYPLVKRPIYKYDSLEEWRYEVWYNSDGHCFRVADATAPPAIVECGTKTYVFLTFDSVFDYSQAEEKYGYIRGVFFDYDGEGNLQQQPDLSDYYQAAVAVLEEGQVQLFTDEAHRFYYDFGRSRWQATRIGPNDEGELAVPTVLQGCDPRGGGTSFQSINLLNPWVTESFCCKENKNNIKFQLSSSFAYRSSRGNLFDTWQEAREGVGETQYQAVMLSSIAVKVLVVTEEQANGEDGGEIGTVQNLTWARRWLRAGDKVDSNAKTVTLSPTVNNVPPDGQQDWIKVGTGSDGSIGASPLTGEDNVRITYCRKKEVYQEGFRRVCAAVCGTQYGVGGWRDRIFLGGSHNPDRANRIYYSALEDPLYIGDLQYIELEKGTQVRALDGTGGALTAITDQGIVLVSGQATGESETDTFVADALFTLSSRIQAPAPILPDTAVFGGEIVYLSAEGVIAVAARENYDARYAEHRSAMIDRVLCHDTPLGLLNWGRFLLIPCEEGVCWLLDENQPTSTAAQPYSTRQFEGWRFENFKSHTLFTDGDTLYSVYKDTVFRWASGTCSTDFHDEWSGRWEAGTWVPKQTAIFARWETPWLFGTVFYRKKIFMKLGLLMETVMDRAEGKENTFMNTAVLVEGKKNDEDWKVLWGYDGKLCSFGYDAMDYRLFTYAGKPGVPDMARKIKVKKALRFKLRFTNDFLNQPFILREFGLDYVQEN